MTREGECTASANLGTEEVQELWRLLQLQQLNPLLLRSAATGNSPSPTTLPPPPPVEKKKRNLPGTPGDKRSLPSLGSSSISPYCEVIALSPRSLMTTNRFVCEICRKGFQRDQNLQLHRRGHNLPWKLRQRTSTEARKRVYVCPEGTCVHHDPSRALGDLTGIKKHFCRKHGEKNWKCDRCSKRYAVQSDLKAHSKTCSSREYKCDCGSVFSRRDSFVTHRAFCNVLAEESSKASHRLTGFMTGTSQGRTGGSQCRTILAPAPPPESPSSSPAWITLSWVPLTISSARVFSGIMAEDKSSSLMKAPAHMSATALLQRAAQVGARASANTNPSLATAVLGSWMQQPYDFRSHFTGDACAGLGSQFFNTSVGCGGGSVLNDAEMFLGMTAVAGIPSSLFSSSATAGSAPGAGRDPSTVDFLESARRGRL
ncbi:unnamed protein product [Spirodela intermedia]|uniref:Protein EARLY HEADING DATE 2 n=1 Tax=Spirodela intermedia TaxID=51605 RepID=A0A7I8IB44_SPIIN|nr:unnamed protein product [Spirodela intermedia]CAA6654252.1 unnamed protein product [Spirodela intermedia]